MSPFSSNPKAELQYLPEVGVFKDETKTKSSHRVIKVPSSALVSLRQYRTWQRMTFLKNGLPWNESCQVFVTQNGTPMHPDTLTSWFGGFIKTTDLTENGFQTTIREYTRCSKFDLPSTFDKYLE